MTEKINESKVKMNKVIENLEAAFQDIRTGSANPNMLSKVEVEYYGTMTPLSQVSSITVVEGRQLYIKPFDPTLTSAIEKAIFASNIGLTPQNESNAIRISVPQLTEERRKEYTKVVAKYAEEAKVSCRNVRRDALDTIKKDKASSEDLRKMQEEEIQKITDEFTKKIDELCGAKQREIMTI